MSKQEKLISADKLQKEIETEIGYLSGDSNYQRGRVEGYRWVLARMHSGTFNSDPVPTIKPGDITTIKMSCGFCNFECEVQYDSKAFGDPDEGHCPYCGSTVDLEVVKE